MGFVRINACNDKCVENNSINFVCVFLVAHNTFSAFESQNVKQPIISGSKLKSMISDLLYSTFQTLGFDSQKRGVL